jgi:hypothetical protein
MEKISKTGKECKNCHQKVDANFCSNCGQAIELKRIDGHYILNEIKHILHFEKGIFYTMRELLVRPGKNIRNFIGADRNRLVKPILFIIVTSLVYSLVNHYFHIEDGYMKIDDAEQSATLEIFKWISDHYGYANIIMGGFIAMFLKLFFRKHDYNFFEILILLCFVMGMGMLLFALFAAIQGIFTINLMQFAGLIAFIYTSWAIGQFYDGSKFINYVKAFFAYLLGFIAFSLVAVLLGTLIDQISI